ncbi:NRDE family protein [Reinekea blandensis]|uniref:NRDE family protein n=1 Tax=Reinekea blandensis MED297 TaxID=314283 RepID=A4BGL9_9GAMM|nr:NRDE family protein [Reinekea blandensis]EAR08667.1 hypothetical protein MED297_14165 [Reinekea sp. MED297] [Reinekea blandensis MED297]
MCLAVIDYQPDRTVPVRIVTNRDEFRDRPARDMHLWPDQPIVAGQDLKAGGTWMGVTTDRRFALLTNIRPGYVGVQGERSRGDLVVSFLAHQDTIETFHANIRAEIQNYAGFNLLLGDARRVFWFSSDHPDGQWLAPGIHALSNDALNTPWPKTELAREQMVQQGQQVDQGSTQHTILGSTQTAPIASLPNTGIPPDWEARLSAQTIIGEGYGTRTRTQLALSHDQALLIETQLNTAGKSEREVRFTL